MTVGRISDPKTIRLVVHHNRLDSLYVLTHTHTHANVHKLVVAELAVGL